MLVCLFSCRDVDIRSRPSSFCNHCNSCRDLKSMSRPFLLPIQSQSHFSVSTIFIQFSISGCDPTFLPFAEIYVATSISCRDIISVASYVDLCCDNVCLFIVLSRHGIKVATHSFPFSPKIYIATLKSCRDIISPHHVTISFLSHNSFFSIHLLSFVVT